MITTAGAGLSTRLLTHRPSTTHPLARPRAAGEMQRRAMSIPLPTPRRSLIAAGTPASHIARDRKSGRTVAVFRGVHVDAAHAVALLPHFRAALATQGPNALLGMQSSAVTHGLRWLPPQWSVLSADVHLV